MKTISKILIAGFLLMLTSVAASAQSVFFKECAKIPGVQTVYISKLMLGMASKSNLKAGGMEIGSMVGKLDGLEIINAEGKAAAKALSKKIEPLQGEVLLAVTDDEADVTILLNPLPDGRSEYRLINRQSNELVIINFIGTLTMEEVVAAINM